MNRISILSLIALLIFAVSNFAYAQKSSNWWDNQEIAKKLNLTEKQLNKLKSIDGDYANQVSSLSGDLQKFFGEFMNMINSPKPTNKEITSKYNEMLSKQNKIGEIELEKQLKIRDVLKDDQIVILGEIRKEQWENLKKMGQK